MKLFSPLIRPIGVLFRIRRYFDRQVKVAPGLVGTEVPETGQTKDSVVLRKGWYFDIDFDWLTRSLYNEGTSPPASAICGLMVTSQSSAPVLSCSLASSRARGDGAGLF